ncbi:uncharacterized protein A1O9_06394 [Exophiala aquamarina CBS 119918]|uniref:Uncharacterized protein n=1 Tax=Exophiala aquamarina CBS 119918 TaxID=1182545 RepID=A0A072PGN4_9EURO|nr:uncharacterized protein A1O9_06394 [Exophiala aquamarina CBS 119918]KEF58468.1 hypothetical protein A1O9_06394 [Exophiala aquamarina CBS 119918]
MILRAEILRDSAFQYAFTHDFWMGQRQNTGDDNFITRWVLFGHLFENSQPESNASRRKWKIGIQLTREAQVSTSIMPDSRFAGQMKRWCRSGLRHRLMCLLYEPGIRGMWRTCPFMTRKMVEAMLNPILVWIRIYYWFKTAAVYPRLACLIVGYKIYKQAITLRRFKKEYPWIRKHLWAALLVDRLNYISDWYCWMTLGNDAWVTRATIDE